MTNRRSKRYLPEGWTLPLPNEFNRPFFTAGQLCVQRCEECQLVQHPPMDICRRCQSQQFAYEPSVGTGSISTFTIVHHAVDRRLEDAVPYNVVVVSLDDHPEVLVVGNVIDAAADELAIGARVRCTFAEVEDQLAGETLWLPQWELLRDGGAYPSGTRPRPR
jgi:uncharacterized OB-fold protein